jgi:broad specificity phosphatase PhoE
LHEHERDTVVFLRRAEFEAAVAGFFARPDELALGRETAAQALDRFSRAVDGVLAAHPQGTVAIVTHGTVLSLFVAARTGVDPFPFWRDLALPELVVQDLPG